MLETVWYPVFVEWRDRLGRLYSAWLKVDPLAWCRDNFTSGLIAFLWKPCEICHQYLYIWTSNSKEYSRNWPRDDNSCQSGLGLCNCQKALRFCLVICNSIGHPSKKLKSKIFRLNLSLLSTERRYFSIMERTELLLPGVVIFRKQLLPSWIFIYM